MEEASKDVTKVNVARKLELLKSYWLQQTEKINKMADAEQTLHTNEMSSYNVRGKE